MVVIFRVRRRGASVELVVDEVLTDAAGGADARASATEAVVTALRRTGADYAIMLSPHRPGRSWLPLPGGGPMLTCRPLDQSPVPQLAAWDLSLGDIELF